MPHSPLAQSVKSDVLPHIFEPFFTTKHDGKGVGLREPEGVACGPAGLLAVADTGNGRIVLYDMKNDAVVPRADFAVPELPYPIRLQLNANGEILALDRSDLSFSPDGRYQVVLRRGAGVSYGVEATIELKEVATGE